MAGMSAAPAAAGPGRKKTRASTNSASRVLINAFTSAVEDAMSWLASSKRRRNALHTRPQSALKPRAVQNFALNRFKSSRARSRFAFSCRTSAPMYASSVATGTSISASLATGSAVESNLCFAKEIVLKTSASGCPFMGTCTGVDLTSFWMARRWSIHLGEFMRSGASACLSPNSLSHTSPKASSACKGLLYAIRNAWAASRIKSLHFVQTSRMAKKSSRRCEAAPSAANVSMCWMMCSLSGKSGASGCLARDLLVQNLVSKASSDRTAEIAWSSSNAAVLSFVHDTMPRIPRATYSPPAAGCGVSHLKRTTLRYWLASRASVMLVASRKRFLVRSRSTSAKIATCFRAR